MKRGLVVYTTRTKDTEKIANLIAEGMRFGGMEAKVVNVKDIKNEQDLEGWDAFAFGAPTYHGEMLQAMKTFLFLAEKANLEGKIGGAFGAFGWSGESPDRIYDTMKNIFKMNMVSQSLRLKNADLGGGVSMAQDYGKDIAKKAE